MTSVITIDKQIWINLLNQGGIEAINDFTSNYDMVFTSADLRAEISSGVAGDPNFSTKLNSAFEGWENDLKGQGRLLQLNDRLSNAEVQQYNPKTGGGDEKADAAFRKFFTDADNANGYQITLVSDDTELFTNRVNGVERRIVDFEYEGLTQQGFFSKLLSEKLINPEDFDKFQLKLGGVDHRFRTEFELPTKEVYAAYFDSDLDFVASRGDFKLSLTSSGVLEVRSGSGPITRFDSDAIRGGEIGRTTTGILDNLSKGATVASLAAIPLLLLGAGSAYALDIEDAYGDTEPASIVKYLASFGFEFSPDFLIEAGKEIAKDAAITAVASLTGVGLIKLAKDLKDGASDFYAALGLAAEYTDIPAIDITYDNLSIAVNFFSSFFDSPSARPDYDALNDQIIEIRKVDSALGAKLYGELTLAVNVPTWTVEELQEKLAQAFIDHNLERIDGVCFPAGTLVEMADGSSTPIEDIKPADWVLSFDPETLLKLPRQVVRLFQGETKKWVVLDYEVDGEQKTLTATPNHPFLKADGSFAPIAELINAYGQAEIVLRDGQVVSAKANLIVYSAETAERYEQAYSMASAGNVALAPAPRNAWATYNFEVHDTHTYIAEQVCVHNRCLEQFVTENTLNALVAEGIVNREDAYYSDATGQWIARTPEGEIVTEGVFEGQLVVKAIEVLSDFAEHVGHSITQVFEDFGEYLEGGLQGLFTDLLNGSDFETSVNSYAKTIVAEMGVDVLAGIFGLQELPRDIHGNLTVPNLDDPAFFDTEIGGAVKGALVSAATMRLITGEKLSSDDYEQLALNSSVKFVVTKALETQSWALNELIPDNVANSNLFEGIFDHASVGPVLSLGAQSAASAAVSLLIDLFDGGIENPAAALGNAGVAAGSTYLSGVVVGTYSSGAAAGSWSGGLLSSSLNGLSAFAGPAGFLITAAIGVTLGKLFEGVFTPPPPFFNIQRSDDGSETVYIADRSGGYIYIARDGEDDVLVGNSGHDALVGSSGDNELHGLEGNDRLLGGGGDDVLTGGKGRDDINGGAGDDEATGGQGNDTVNGGDGNDLVIGGDGNDLLFGDNLSDLEEADHAQRSSVSELGEVGSPDDNSSGGDYVTETGSAVEDNSADVPDVTNNDVIFGGAGNDRAFAGSGHDFVNGGFGDDVLLGQAGADVVLGGAHDDFINGGSGDDVLDGEAGSDKIYGGAGDDVAHGDKMVVLRDTPVTLAIIDWLETRVKVASDLKGTLGINEYYHSMTNLEDAPFNGAFSLGDIFLTKVSNVESALIAQLEGNVATKSDLVSEITSALIHNELTSVDSNTISNIVDEYLSGESNALDIAISHIGQQVAVNLSGGVAPTHVGVIGALLAGFPAEKIAGSFMAWLAENDESLKSQIENGDFGYLASDYEAPIDDPNTEENEAKDDPGQLLFTLGDGDDFVQLGGGDDLGYGGRGHDTLIGGDGDDVLYGDGLSSVGVDAGTGDDEVYGGDGNDEIITGEGDNIVEGGKGDDRIFAGAGNDNIHGDGGADVISSGDGDDVIYAGNSGYQQEVDPESDFNLLDIVHAGAGNDTVHGEGGADFLTGGTGNDELYGGDGADELSGDEGNDILLAGAGDDVVFGGNGHDTLHGEAGNDLLNGDLGNDSITGGDGNDIIQAGFGDDQVRGGNGNDTILGEIGGDSLAGGKGDDRLSGGSDMDILNGDEGNDTLFGGSGNDKLYGGVGDDELEGGVGSDTIVGQNGNDRIYGDEKNNIAEGEADQINSGNGDDIVYAGAGDDVVQAGNGNDEVIAGTGDDTVSGGGGDDMLNGDAGEDDLIGGDGNDQLYGGSGDDELDGGNHDDTIDGGTGNDLISAGSGDDQVTDNSGADAVDLGYGNDRFISDSSDTRGDIVNGGAGDDDLIGGSGDDLLKGGIGSDTLEGGAGQDVLNAGDGNDTVNGGTDADTLISGRGVQILNGGDGNDLYQVDLAGLRATIADSSGVDKIELSGYYEPKDILLEVDGDDLLLRSRADPEDHIRIIDQFIGLPKVEAVSFASHPFALDLTNMIIGTDGDDEIVGTENNDIVLAMAGNDMVVGAGGHDFLDGGPGNDIIFGNAGNDTLNGSSEDDLLNGGANNDAIIDGIGSDMLIGGEGNDVFGLTANAGDHDTIADFEYGQDKIDLITFGDQFVSLKQMEYFGADFFMKGSDTELNFDDNQKVTIEGLDYRFLSESDFEFELYERSGTIGTDENDIIIGGTGADIINGGAGFDIMTGGAGADTFIIVPKTSKIDPVTGETVPIAGEIDQIVDFSVFEDVIDLTAFSDHVSIYQFEVVQRGEDVTISFGANQHLILENVQKGQLSLDHFLFHLFEDKTDVSRYDGKVLHDFTADQVIEAEAAFSESHFLDLVDLIEDGAGADFDRGNGQGASNYGNDKDIFGTDAIGSGEITSDAESGINADHSIIANNPWVDGILFWQQTVYPIELDGTDQDDYLIGNFWDETIYGLDGDDDIQAGNGHDFVVAGDGHDFVQAGAGADTLFGGNGDDYLAGGDDADTLFGRSGHDKLYGGSGFDTIYGESGNDQIAGDGGADLLMGMAGNDSLSGGNGEDTIYGGSGNDTARGNGEDDLIDGGDGHDVLRGDSGDDSIYGGDGNDHLSGGDDSDLIEGGSGNDGLYGGDHTDRLFGGLGNDRIEGGHADDTLEGGDGHDFLQGDIGDDNLRGDDGKDHVTGGDGDDKLYGGEDNDQLYGGLNEDSVYGGNGNDALFGGGDRDRLSGGDGDDHLDGGEANDRVYGGVGDDDVYGSNGNDYLFGADGSDRLFGGDDRDLLYGGDGSDDVIGGAGDDTLNGGSGNDFVRGNDGNDTLNGELGNDVLLGEHGNDLLNGGSGEDLLKGGEGRDLLFGGDDNDSLHAGDAHDTAEGGAGSDWINGETGDDHLLGGSGDDHLLGENGDDVIQGQSGSDLIDGGSGNDYLEGGEDRDIVFGRSGDNFILGGSGADFLIGGTGDEIVHGGSGSDLIRGLDGSDYIDGGTNGDFIDGGDGHDYLLGRHGNDEIYGGKGDDLIAGGDDHDQLFGGRGEDHLKGADGDDLLFGGEHNDILRGGAGIDFIAGGSGADQLFGGNDADRIVGGMGADLLYGGSGADVFEFYSLDESTTKSIDVIADFDSGEDRIDLSYFDVVFSDLVIVAVNGETDVLLNGTDFKLRILDDDQDLSVEQFYL